VERKEAKMEEMEVAENSIPRVLFRKPRVRHRRFVIAISIFFIILVNYSLLVGFQRSRYDIENFNCVQFTREAVLYFRAIGIKSYQVVGDCKDSDARHSWVGIDFFGYIINYEPQCFLPFIPEWRYENIWLNNNTIK
jgi:hypothetical protein